jgi:hypothetical protein
MVRRGLVALAFLMATCLAAGGALAEEAAAPAAGASSRAGFGLGVILGEPTGASMKLFFDEHSALQIHAAWDFTDAGIAVIVDYLYHFDPIALESAVLALPLYIGGGLKFVQRPSTTRRVTDGSKFQFGLRLPIGIACAFKKFPLELFLEVAPGLRLISATDFDIDGGVGVRWYF